jgi:hypothetical protein
MMEEYKRGARQALHDAMFASGSYIPPNGDAGDAVPVKVRWHNRMQISGERSSDDVAILEGINRLIFNSDNLAELGLTLEQLGTVEIVGYNKTFRLDYAEEGDGPLNVYWSVIALS